MLPLRRVDRETVDKYLELAELEQIDFVEDEEGNLGRRIDLMIALHIGPDVLDDLYEIHGPWKATNSLRRIAARLERRLAARSVVAVS